MIIGLPNGNSGLSAHLCFTQLRRAVASGVCPASDGGTGHAVTLGDFGVGVAVAMEALDAGATALCRVQQEQDREEQQDQHPSKGGADHGPSCELGGGPERANRKSGEDNSGTALMTIALLLRLRNRLCSSHGETPLSNHGMPSKNHLQ